MLRSTGIYQGHVGHDLFCVLVELGDGSVSDGMLAVVLSTALVTLTQGVLSLHDPQPEAGQALQPFRDRLAQEARRLDAARSAWADTPLRSEQRGRLRGPVEEARVAVGSAEAELRQAIRRYEAVLLGIDSTENGYHNLSWRPDDESRVVGMWLQRQYRLSLRQIVHRALQTPAVLEALEHVLLFSPAEFDEALILAAQAARPADLDVEVLPAAG